MQSPYFVLRHLVVVGGEYLTEDKVPVNRDLHPGTNILHVNTRQLTRDLAQLPFIEDVKVSRRLPGSLVVHVVEKTPIAYIAVGRGFWTVDAEGTVLYGEESLTKSLPLITSDKLFTVEPSDIVNIPHLRAAIDFASALTFRGVTQLSEIHASDTRLVAFTSDYITINLGFTGDMREKAGVLEALLTKISEDDIPVSHIDVRHPRTPIVEQKR